VRVTSSAYYNNIYGENNKLNRQLFDVNKQISSGLKIQYAHDDPTVFVDTLRLDDEITTLTQVKSSSESAYKFSTQTDTTIGDIVKTIESLKVKLVNAATDSNSDTSLYAIAQEMRGLQNHLTTLANTSIGGQYLFSGTATDQKPIDQYGVYQGNAEDMSAFLGSGIKQKYNITGAQLFLGNESQVPRTVTTNVAQMSLTDLYPDIMKDVNLSRNAFTETYIKGTNTIRDLMGDNDTDPTNDATRNAYFYVQGTRTTGETFKTQIALPMDATVDELMTDITNAYLPNKVTVQLNAHGQIEVIDRQTGSSKLDFHMVGAVDFSGGGAANVVNIDALQAGTTDFETAAVTTPGLYIKEFTKSGFDPSNPANAIEGINYDRTYFEQKGSKLLSNISQIVGADNSYATPSTKLSDVAGVSTLNGEQLIIQGKDITGAAFTAQIDLAAGGSTFTVNGNGPYDIFTATAPRTAVPADDMTYQQLLDVVNMAMSGTLPAANTATDYDTAIKTANSLSSTTLDYAGRLVFEDKTQDVTLAAMSIYDSSSADYSITQGASLTFNANSALTIRDPKNDFFAQIEEMIRSVEEMKKRPDGSESTDPRNIGVQNAIQMIDDLSEHVTRLQTEVGSYSQVLQSSSDRAQLLIVSTKTLQSEVIDTDIAEATLRMQQLQINYQSMLASISRVSQLSLVNYL